MATSNSVPLRHINRGQDGPELFRVLGSGFTAFHWQGKLIGKAFQISHTSPQPVAQPVAIQPLDARYPLQIITPAAITAGTLTLQRYETYNGKIWDDLMRIIDNTNTSINTNRLTTYNDLAEVFIRLANIGKGISATKLIFPPNKVQKTKSQYYADTYHNCVITDIRDDEQVQIGSMESVKVLTIQYTHSTRNASHA